MSSNVRITQTTTTTTSTASVLVVNTGYCKSKLGFLKLLLLILSLLCFILLTLKLRWLINTNDFLFLLLINFSNLFIVALMLLCCLLSLSTAALLPKMTFDFVYHFVACGLYLAAGLWAISYAMDSFTVYKTASILAFVIALLHAVHGYMSYAACRLH